MDPISYNKFTPSAPPPFDAPYNQPSAPPYQYTYASRSQPSYSAPPILPPLPMAQIPQQALCFFCGTSVSTVARLPCGCSVYAHESCGSSQIHQLIQCPLCRSTIITVSPNDMLRQQVQVLQGEQEAVARRRALRGGCCLILVVVGILVWVIVRYVVHVE